MTEWFQVKLLLTELTGLSRDALHILLGVAVQLGVASLLRHDLGRLGPWLAAVIAAVGNEWLDLHHERWPDLALQRAESLKDLVATMAIPTALLLIVRYAPALVTRGPATEEPAA